MVGVNVVGERVESRTLAERRRRSDERYFHRSLKERQEDDA